MNQLITEVFVEQPLASPRSANDLPEDPEYNDVTLVNNDCQVFDAQRLVLGVKSLSRSLKI